MENNRCVIYAALSRNNNYFGGELATVTDKTVTVLVPPELQYYYRKNNKRSLCSAHAMHNCKEAVVPKQKCLLMEEGFSLHDLHLCRQQFLKGNIKKLDKGMGVYFFTGDGIPMIGRIIKQGRYGVTLAVNFMQSDFSRTIAIRREYTQIIPVGMIASYL